MHFATRVLAMLDRATDPEQEPLFALAIGSEVVEVGCGISTNVPMEREGGEVQLAMTRADNDDQYIAGLQAENAEIAQTIAEDASEMVALNAQIAANNEEIREATADRDNANAEAGAILDSLDDDDD